MDFEVDQHRIGVFSTWEVNRVTEGVGFKTHIYGDYSEIHWDEEKMNARFLYVKTIMIMRNIKNYIREYFI